MTVTETVEAPVAGPETNAVIRPRPGEWVIAGTVLVFFLFAFVLAQEWPFRAALFPLLISSLGMGLTVVRLVQLAVLAVRAGRHVVAVTPVHADTAAAVPEQPEDSSPEAQQVRVAAHAAATPQERQSLADVALVDEEAEEDESMDYVFASAGGRAWAAALAWVVAFFVAFFVLGAFIAVPLFALVYLRFSGRASWLAAALYAAVTGLIIYLVFRELVYIPLPEPVFPFLAV